VCTGPERILVNVKTVGNKKKLLW